MKGGALWEARCLLILIKMSTNKERTMQKRLPQMKLLVAFLLFAFAISCSDQSNTKVTPPNPFVGRWELPRRRTNAFQQSPGPYIWIEIKEKGVCQIEENSGNSTLRNCTWKATGNQLTVTTPHMDDHKFNLRQEGEQVFLESDYVVSSMGQRVIYTRAR
jgi:hypothetical protein